MSNGFSFESAKDIDQKLFDMVDQHLQNNGTVEIACPHCGVILDAHLGENTCPSCGGLVVVGVNADLD